ncbi:MAG: molybdopterin biosynthesis protein MoeB [Proteobacteria bacterium]|nr:molybdopterin biosynthesis protein MoeB [Pseudomonadota bacterium]
MDDKQLLRFSRHILLPEIGIDGQERVLDAHALVIGAGGLGAPVSMYLAASGIGKLTIADGDTVDLTNLQRQIIHATPDIGKKKVLSAKETLEALNPNTLVDLLDKKLSGDELSKAVSIADIVLDCSDNFETRHQVNRACTQFKKPLVSGAAIRFEGQISVFDQSKPNSPCYECLYPADSDFEETKCAELGVLSPLVGLVGTIQAIEALKILMEIGDPMIGKLLLVNGLSADWKVLKLLKDPACTACHQDP